MSAIHHTAKHTPGPWTYSRFLGEQCEIYCENWEALAIVHGNEDDPELAEQGRANARLIAAAPDLLAACDEALNALIGAAVAGGGVDDRKHLQDAKNALRAAIAKATKEPA